MKFLISESEKQEILKLYGVISEQQSIVYLAQTDKKKKGLKLENKVDKLPNAQTDNQFTLKQA